MQPRVLAAAFGLHRSSSLRTCCRLRRWLGASASAGRRSTHAGSAMNFWPSKDRVAVFAFRIGRSVKMVRRLGLCRVCLSFSALHRGGYIAS